MFDILDADGTGTLCCEELSEGLEQNFQVIGLRVPSLSSFIMHSSGVEGSVFKVEACV